MLPIQINPDLCRRDGICADECPMKIFTWSGKDSLPLLRSETSDRCIDCGHCVAACPSGALTHKTSASLALDPQLAIGPEQVAQFLRSRRSIRRFRDGLVPRDLILKAIDVARYAPSGHNAQPVQWLVVSGHDVVRSLAGRTIDWMRRVQTSQPDFAARLQVDSIIRAWEKGHDMVLRGAPHLVIAHARKADHPAPLACTIALTWFELAAASLGLGACWAGYFQLAASSFEPLLHALDLPSSNQCNGVMMVGWPRHLYHRIPSRRDADITWK